MSDALLTLENVNTFYGPVQAHFDLNLTVGRGTIHAGRVQPASVDRP